MTDFEKKKIKLKNLNENVTSNKTKYLLVEIQLNELLEEVKAISRKGSTKDLINKFSIPNDSKYFKTITIYTSQKIH